MSFLEVSETPKQVSVVCLNWGWRGMDHQYQSPIVNECYQFSYQLSNTVSVNLAKFYPSDKLQSIFSLYFFTNVVNPLCISIFDPFILPPKKP